MSTLIPAVSEWKDEKYYQVQVKHFSYDRDGHEQGYEWMTFAEKFDSVKAILKSPQYSNMQLVHKNIRILVTSQQYLVLRTQQNQVYHCKSCGTHHPDKPLLNMIHGEALCPDCDDYSGDGIYQ